MGKSSVFFVAIVLGLLVFIGYAVSSCLNKVVAATCATCF